MNSTPTPEEARDALRAVDEGRTRTAARAGWPAWVWVAAGIVVAAYGIVADRRPDFTRTWGTTVVVFLLLAAMAVNTRRGGALFGRRARPRASYDRASLLWSALVVIVLIGGAALAGAMNVPHVALWTGLIGGVLLAVAGPWWQRRVLARGAGH